MFLVEAEKAGRDGRSAEELCRRSHRLHDEETKAAQGALRELTERLEAVTKLKEQESAKRLDAQEQLRELRTSSEKLRVTVSSNIYSTTKFNNLLSFYYYWSL